MLWKGERKTSFSERLEEINTAVNAFAWGPFMLLLLVGTGVYLSVRTRFVQLRVPSVWKHTLGSLFSREKRDDGGNLSPFQAVSTALAGTVGTGNIAGVAGALFLGGPGAVFWMWVSAFFGMATKYAEIALAVKYRQRDEAGRVRGGPMYTITGGLGRKWRWLARLFALFGGLAAFGIGNIAQASEIADAVQGLTDMKPPVTGILLAVLLAPVILGGVKWVGAVTARLVPAMGLLYLFLGIFVIALRANSVPAVVFSILQGAFSLRSAGSGVLGYTFVRALRTGVSRGVFSNEAGLGSAPIAHASSSAGDPAKQALWGIFEVFVDTFVVCTVTAFAVLLSGVAYSDPAAFSSNGAAAVAAFDTVLPGSIGGVLLRISLVCFALSTILGWSFYGEVCWGFLFRRNKLAVLLYKAVFLLVTVFGAAGAGRFMWSLSDTLNGLMAIPNLIALIPLAGEVSRLTRDFFHPSKTPTPQLDE